MEPSDDISVQGDAGREDNGTKRYCFNCGKELIPASAPYCPYCGTAQEQIPTEPEVPPAEVSLAQRTTALNEAIAHFTAQGFRVVTKSQTSAQLMRPKQFSWLAAILSLLLLGIGFLIYRVYYLGQKDETIFLEVTSDGTVLKDGHPFSSAIETPPLKPAVEAPSVEVEEEKRTEQIEARRLGWLVPVIVIIGAVVLVICVVVLRLMLFPTSSPTPYSTPTPYHTPTPHPTKPAPPAVLVTPTPTVSSASATPIVHVVQPGDTLSRIAALYGSTSEAICAFNELADCKLITPGQELMIPGEGPVLPSPTKTVPLASPTAPPTATPIPPTPVPYRAWREKMTSAMAQAEAWVIQIDSEIISNYQEQSSCPLAEQIHDSAISVSVDLFMVEDPDSWNCKRAEEEVSRGLTDIGVATHSMLGYCRYGDSIKLTVASDSLTRAQEHLSSARHYYDMCIAE